MKAFLHYIVLVGIPVVSVFVFLRIGERSLTAPTSVGGNWKLETILQEENGQCASLDFRDEDPMLNISQSGRYLVLTFNDEKQTTLSAVLSGAILSAEGPISTGSENLLSSFKATIDRQTEPDRLDGTFQIASCTGTLSFSAIREPESTSTTGDH